MEYFITAVSWPAPFCSDTSEAYTHGATAREALERFVKEYDHPSGLWSAQCWQNADAYHKKRTPLAKWRCFKFQRELTEHTTEHNPRDGSIV